MNKNSVAVELHLWQADLADWPLSQLEAEYGHWLNPSQQARFARLLPSQAKHRLLLGQVFLRRILSGYLGEAEPQNLSFVRGSHGKPYLAAAHVADYAARHGGELLFNLSDSRERLILAVGLTGVADAAGATNATDKPAVAAETTGAAVAETGDKAAIGVDMEWTGRQRRINAIARRHFTEAEYTALAGMPEAARLQRFYTLWTLKEAYTKARGLGLSLPLDLFGFSVGSHGSSSAAPAPPAAPAPALASAAAPQPARLSAEFLPALPGHQGHWHFCSLQTCPDYRIAIALTAPQPMTITTPIHALRFTPAAFSDTPTTVADTAATAPKHLPLSLLATS